uniref:Uncharacterized protein n=1 Tax=Hucho hucho TaxID=62062 RepID=A0A4W5JSY6_9TELE
MSSFLLLFHCQVMSTFRAQIKHEKKVPSPEKNLLEHSKEPKLTESKIFFSHLYDTFKKTQIAAKADNRIMGIHSKKDFPFENIMALLENSGLVLKYIKKNINFSLHMKRQHTDEVRRAQDRYESYVKERMYHESRMESSSPLPVLLMGHSLSRTWKKNWRELHHQDIDLIERYKTIYIANNN